MRMMEGLGLFFVFCLFILDDECRDETDQQFFSSRTPTLTQKRSRKILSLRFYQFQIFCFNFVIC